MDKINSQPLYDWFKANKKQLIIASVFLIIGIIVLNQLMGIYAKAELLLTPCQLCIEQGYTCTQRINFFNITLP